jgi:Flp pilus assembly protein TadB
MPSARPQSRSSKAWQVTRANYTTPRYLLLAIPEWLLLIVGLVLLVHGSVVLAVVLIVIALGVDLLLRRKIRKDLQAAGTDAS